MILFVIGQFFMPIFIIFNIPGTKFYRYCTAYIHFNLHKNLPEFLLFFMIHILYVQRTESHGCEEKNNKFHWISAIIFVFLNFMLLQIVSCLFSRKLKQIIKVANN